MRVDLFLKKARIFKQRTMAQKACQNDLITINHSIAKASREVKAGDIIEIELPQKHTQIKVLDTPDGNVSKEKAKELYEILSETRNDLF